MGLEVKDLSSGYRQVPVIKDINFNIDFGQVVGLVGLNGAGKSTLLKTILGLLSPLSGQVTINQQSIIESHRDYAQQIAYIPEVPILYDELTLREHLEMTALGYDIHLDTLMERAQPLLKQFRLDKYMDWFPTHFSKGMKQKVMIICALVTDAKLLIIDEPFLGLDPLAIRDFIALLKERADQGTAILLTTHMLSTTADLCDAYLMMKEGRLVAQGSLADLQTQFNLQGSSLDDIYIKMANQENGQKVEAEQDA